MQLSATLVVMRAARAVMRSVVCILMVENLVEELLRLMFGRLIDDEDEEGGFKDHLYFFFDRTWDAYSN